MNNYIKSACALQAELDGCGGLLPRLSIDHRNTIVPLDVFDELVTDKQLKRIVEKLFRDGHHARAVEEAFKFIDNLVKRLSKQNNLSGASLMTKAFSADRPLLRLNTGQSVSEQDEQKGYMQILAGCMTGIRNPRAHECDWEDSEKRAIEMLAWANHLIERIRLAAKTTDTSLDPT